MKKKYIYKAIFICSLIVFFASAISLIKLYLPEDNDMQQYKTDPPSEIATPAVHETTNEEPTTVLADNPINFKKLTKDAPDVYSWITIPGTDIDYAIAQSSKDKDDLFYLDHNIHGDYEFAGTIFSQKRNSTDYSDPVTVLYGHNMLNGTMFADLHNFESEKFFNKHDTIYIYTPGHILTYKIVSAYVYDNRHILNTFDFSNKKDIKEYFQSITEPKSMVQNVRPGIKLTTKDRVLTLSTCTNSDSQRYLVQGVLVDDQLTK